MRNFINDNFFKLTNLAMIIALCIIVFLATACEFPSDKQNKDNVKQCEKDGGKALITYCDGTSRICEVKCLKGDSNE